MADLNENELSKVDSIDYLRGLKGLESVSISKELFIAMIDEYSKFIHLIPAPSDFDTADIGYSVVDEHILHSPSDNDDYGNIGIALTLRNSVYGAQMFFAFVDHSLYFRIKVYDNWGKWKKVTSQFID